MNTSIILWIYNFFFIIRFGYIFLILYSQSKYIDKIQDIIFVFHQYSYCKQ